MCEMRQPFGAEAMIAPIFLAGLLVGLIGVGLLWKWIANA
jgi:hypothetical protein